MSTVKIAAGLAALIAGPQLYGLVQSGDMTTQTALLRGGLVLAACAVGVHGISLLVSTYDRERIRQEKIARALKEMEGVTLEGIPLPRDGERDLPADPASPGVPTAPVAPTIPRDG